MHENFPKTLSENSHKLSKVIIECEKKIEDIDEGIKVDFANKFIGGGVLSRGCV